MPHALIKTGALALALGGFALPAHALSPRPFDGVVSLAIPVADEGTYIKEEERPNQVQPGSQQDVAPKYVEPQTDGGGSSNAGEVQELQRAFPSTEWPPSMHKD